MLGAVIYGPSVIIKYKSNFLNLTYSSFLGGFTRGISIICLVLGNSRSLRIVFFDLLCLLFGM